MTENRDAIRVGDIRVGLIGYGFAGKSFHGPLLRTVPGLKVTVVGSTRRDAVLADFPDVAVCPAEEVTAHPDVDLVVVATPNDSHFPLAAAALRAGKDVVVDKPFTVTLAEARELVRIARGEQPAALGLPEPALVQRSARNQGYRAIGSAG